MTLALVALSAAIPAALAQTAVVQNSDSRAPIHPDARHKSPAYRIAPLSGVQKGSLSLPPRVIQAQKFLAERGWKPERRRSAIARGNSQPIGSRPSAQGPQAQAATATWQPLGPTAVVTPSFGLITGRVSALALDPSDSTGNRLYLGTTGGGVWVTQNAATGNTSSVVFAPLTDSVAVLNDVTDSSISIGALSVQPGGTGVILAGTGDPNDALDSYYGAGILRSTDGGNSWSLIAATAGQLWGFAGEGFAGFAWSSVNPQLVVAAVSQAYEGTLVNAPEPNLSYEGLYYSADSGATWNLATITDGTGNNVQGPTDPFAGPDGNAATSVVWNPVRQLFIAAVRYHGYYQSTDGITWTRMAAQPGAWPRRRASCPTNSGSIGSIDCPVFRGTLAVNPQTGDTFAWTTDAFNQDQGLWQDQCLMSAGVCTTQTIAFSKQWSTSPLETNTIDGAATIENGDYTLALQAVPTGLGQGQDTLLLAGADDLWKCSLAEGCVWRNTTNATTCMSGQVGEYQHVLAWNAANPLEIFIGNDSGLWRSLDAIDESPPSAPEPVCSSTDSTHFQNMNGSLGSLAEVMSMSASDFTPYTMMAGLGVNGTAGAVSSTSPTLDWPQILGGEGGPVAIDPQNNTNWFVNNQPGVSIYFCNATTPCTPAAFGTSAAITDADVGGDGYTMATPAPFLVDPLDQTQFLIGTCRVWRGPASGIGWNATNAISPIFDDGESNVSCSGDALIRSIAAAEVSGGEELIYVGMYGSLDGGANLAGHVLGATVNPGRASPVWTDLTLNPVTNDSQTLNRSGFDISSIFIDPHDTTGKTVYVTVEGDATPPAKVQTLYGSTDGGAHWATLRSNLPETPANSAVVDPQSASTVYVATDAGVYFTTQIANCANPSSDCWSVFGSGLPEAPALQLIASPVSSPVRVLLASTYGRGIWQTGLWTGGTALTTANASPTSLTFASLLFGTASSAQTVTLTNTGSIALTPTGIAMNGDFSETDNCANASLAPGESCAIQVTFTPTATGSRAGQMIVSANVSGGQLSVELSGTGTPAGTVSLTPAIIEFGSVQLGTTSTPEQIEAGNTSATAIPITGVTVTSPFLVATNTCATLAAQTDCQVTVEFAPTQSGPVAGTLTFTDGAGTQTVALTGTGAALPTDILNPLSIAFPGTAVGQDSTAQITTLTNTGGLPLTSIAVSVSGPFQVSNPCGTQLAGPASCTISVVFAPTQLGPQTGTLTLSDALRTQAVALSGTGLQAADLSVSPASLTFAAQPFGVASTAQTLAVSNTGGVSLANVGFQITGPAASSFSTGGTTCGGTLADGAGCTVQVIFDPAAGGGNTATLVVSSSTLGVAQVTVPLNGTSQISSGLIATPNQLNFGTLNLGLTSAAQTITVTNISAIAASGFAVGISGQIGSSQFSVAQSTCGGSLAAGASCEAGVVFGPTASGTTSGVLSFSSHAIATPATVSLSGTGAAGTAIEVMPSVIVFATTGVGTVSTPTPITVTNTGLNASLSNLTLAVSAGFVLVNNACGVTLGPGLSCTASVEFAPTVGGAQTGTLTVSSSTAATATSVTLSGAAIDFTLTVSGSISQSISAGQTAGYTLVITPLNGSQGTFTFSCGTLPANTVCTFNPTTETLTGGVGNVIVEISTGGVGTLVHPAIPPGWRLLPLVCGLALMPFGFHRRRRALMIMALLSILVGSVSSCTSSAGGAGGSSGESGGSGGTGSTAAGTYTISPSAASSGVVRSVLLTLTVD